VRRALAFSLLALAWPGACGASPAAADESSAVAGQTLRADAPLVIARPIDLYYPLPIDVAAMRARVTDAVHPFLADVPAFDACMEERLGTRTDRAVILAEALMDCAIRRDANEQAGEIAFATGAAMLSGLSGNSRLHAMSEITQAQEEDDTVPPRISAERRGNTLVLTARELRIGDAGTLQKSLLAEEGLTAIVLDLRGNTGGVLDEVVQLADAFIDEGTLVTVRGKARGETQVYRAESGDAAQGIPLAVLVNEDTSQGGEILAAALQDNGRGLVIGTRTAGQSVIRSVFPVDQDYLMILMASLSERPSGELIEGSGVIPDCLVDPAEDGIVDFAASLARGEATCPA
jgi:hypothetical protein